MDFRFDEDQSQAFSDRVAATAIVNQAAIKCMILGLPVNGENIVRLIGDFFDPMDPRYDGLLDKLLIAVHELASLPDIKNN
jgi:hypothetical protein